MGQHKANPVAIAAKEGRLPPKEKNACPNAKQSGYSCWSLNGE